MSDHVLERLSERAESIDIDRLAGLQATTTRGARRTRRNRTLAFLGSFAVLVGLAAGVGTTLREPDTQNVFAGTEDTETLMPVDVAFVDGKYIGVARIGEWRPSQLSRYVVAESTDGLAWNAVEDAPAFEAAGAAFAVHDGDAVLVAVELAESEGDDRSADGTQAKDAALVTYRSALSLADGAENVWVEQRQALPLQVDAQNTLFAQDLVANDAGLLGSITVWPSNWSALDQHVTELGYDLDELCDSTWGGDRVTFRVCGTSDRQTVDLEVPRSTSAAGAFETHLVFAPPGGDFRVIEPDLGLSVPMQSRRPTIFALPNGFGLNAGAQVFESVDGATWTAIDTREEQQAMMASRGDETVYVSQFGVRRFGPDDPVWGGGFRTGDGEWQQIDLLQVTDDVPQHRSFNQLTASDAGWVVAAYLVPDERFNVEGVERRRSGRSDFTLTATDGSVLTGTTPVGPATLVDAEGSELYTWEQLEVGNPAWSGFDVSTDGVQWIDQETGDVAASFSLLQWTAVLSPNDVSATQFYFSADGREWTVIDQSLTSSTLLAVGENEVVVLRIEAPSLGVDPYVDTIALPGS